MMGTNGIHRSQYILLGSIQLQNKDRGLWVCHRETCSPEALACVGIGDVMGEAHGG